MKILERQNAIKLRKNGLTYSDIQRVLNVSKGALSSWLCDIPYTASEEIRSRRRLASIRNSQVLHTRKIKRVSQIQTAAKKEIKDIKLYELKLLGAMAYWAEGSKTEDSLVKFTNSDPKIIKFILKWLRRVCRVPEEKLRVHIRIHEDLDRSRIEEYWSKVTQIPLKNFFKTTYKISNSNGKRHNKLEYGIASVIVCDTDLFYRIRGWIEGVIENIELCRDR